MTTETQKFGRPRRPQRKSRASSLWMVMLIIMLLNTLAACGSPPAPTTVGGTTPTVDSPTVTPTPTLAALPNAIWTPGRMKITS